LAFSSPRVRGEDSVRSTLLTISSIRDYILDLTLPHGVRGNKRGRINGVKPRLFTDGAGVVVIRVAPPPPPQGGGSATRGIFDKGDRQGSRKQGDRIPPRGIFERGIGKECGGYIPPKGGIFDLILSYPRCSPPKGDLRQGGSSTDPSNWSRIQ
jgi:hypothetical protein